MCIYGSRSRIRVGEIALEEVTRNVEISLDIFDREGTRLLLAFADDNDVVGNSLLTTKDYF